jgi:hypothetical protein
MTTYTRQLTHHQTVTAAATDTVTLTGIDLAANASSVSDPPWSVAGSVVGAGVVRGGRIYNAHATADLWWSYGPVAADVPNPATTTNEGVRRLPAKQTDSWNDSWPAVTVKVSATVNVDYSIEGNP